MSFIITTAGNEIALVSFGLMAMSSLIRRAVVDREQMMASKETMKKNQTIIKEATKAGDTKRAKKAQDEMMTNMMENMKYSFKPMMYTMIPFIVVFSWLKGRYDEVGTVATLLGYELGWFGWYFVCAMLGSIVLNKILGNN